MTVTYGADPTQLSSLGAKLLAQVDVIDQLRTAVTTALGSTAWVGPARTAFETQWNGSFSTALNGMQQAFSAAGTECQTRATALEAALGVAAAAGAAG